MKEQHPNYFIFRKKYFDPLEDLLESKNVNTGNTMKGNILEVTFNYNGKTVKKRFPKSTTFANLRNILSKLMKIDGSFSFALKDENQTTFIYDESRTLDSYSISEESIIYLE
jgi:hypothetical protein